ncbi:hypothetical protein [Brevundimonas balnearis]|uniref:Uncharacterized protein n=1 Tax=Brevundimonas balnearis TaxID=1572858 RepID=A0ABV6R387_9CAUL
MVDRLSAANQALQPCWAGPAPSAPVPPSPSSERAAARDHEPALPTRAAFLTPGSGRVVGYEAFDPEGVLVRRTTFTPTPGSDFGRAADERVWIARRQAVGADGRGTVEVTTSLECSTLVHALEQIANLDPGGFEVIGISPPPASLPPRTFDGYTYRVFGPGRGRDQANTRLSVESNSGEVGALGALADLQLRDCWRPAPTPESSDVGE